MNQSAHNVLIVEDEENLGLTLREYLEGKGHHVDLAKTVKEAREYFQMGNPDVVLMDIGLPDGSGLDLAKDLRNERKDFLLLFLSALNDPDTKVEGLEIGAEDYITKPFALRELNLRLEKSFQLKRELSKSRGELRHGPLMIKFSSFQVGDANGVIIELGQKECAILQLLYNSPERVFSREEIIEAVWGSDKYPSNRTVDNYIVKLRKWCETDTLKHIEIQSIRGIGYKLCLKAD